MFTLLTQQNRHKVGRSTYSAIKTSEAFPNIGNLRDSVTIKANKIIEVSSAGSNYINNFAIVQACNLQNILYVNKIKNTLQVVGQSPQLKGQRHTNSKYN